MRQMYLVSCRWNPDCPARRDPFVPTTRFSSPMVAWLALRRESPVAAYLVAAATLVAQGRPRGTPPESDQAGRGVEVARTCAIPPAPTMSRSGPLTRDPCRWSSTSDKVAAIERWQSEIGATADACLARRSSVTQREGAAHAEHSRAIRRIVSSLHNLSDRVDSVP